MRWLVLAACANAPPQVTTVSPPIVAIVDAGFDAIEERTVDAALAAPVKPAVPIYVEAYVWAGERGVGANQRLDLLGGCVAYKLGAPPRDALVCSGGGPMNGSLKTGESIFPLDVITVEQGKLVTLLRVPLIAGPLDNLVEPDSNDPDHGNYIELLVDVDPSGMKLVIHEQPGDSCTQRVADLRRLETKPGDLNGHVKMVDMACKSRGTYVFKDNVFTKSN